MAAGVVQSQPVAAQEPWRSGVATEHAEGAPQFSKAKGAYAASRGGWAPVCQSGWDRVRVCTCMVLLPAMDNTLSMSQHTI